MASTGRIQVSSNLASSHEAPVGAHRGKNASEGSVNSGQSFLSSCSPSDGVLLRDIKAILHCAAAGNCNKSSFTVRLWFLACRCTPVNSKFTNICTGTKSPEETNRTERKKITFTRQICACAFMQTHKDTDMHGHTQITGTKTDVCRRTPTCFTHIRMNTQTQMRADKRERTRTSGGVYLQKKKHKKTLFLTHGDARRGLTHSAEHEERGNLYD